MPGDRLEYHNGASTGTPILHVIPRLSEYRVLPLAVIPAIPDQAKESHETPGKKFGARHVHSGSFLVHSLNVSKHSFIVRSCSWKFHENTTNLLSGLAGQLACDCEDGDSNWSIEAAIRYIAVSSSFLVRFFGLRISSPSVFVPTHQATPTRQTRCLIRSVESRP